MALDSSNSCELPTSRDQRLERLHAEWVHKYGGGVLGAGFSQHANGAMATEAAEWVATVVMEDTLEDVMYWTGQLMEAYPELAFKVGCAKGFFRRLRRPIRAWSFVVHGMWRCALINTLQKHTHTLYHVVLHLFLTI